MNSLDSVRVNVEVPETVHAGKLVPITLRLQNISDQPVDVYLKGRPVAFDITVAREGREVVWRRLEGTTMSMVLQIRRLAPGEVVELTDTWNQQTNAGEPVSPGRYTIQGVLLTEAPQPLVTSPTTLRIVPQSLREEQR
ncbi:MAG: BsuPI-related putative proteinase inhibitor [Chloroflexota bacterium]|nr:BsuPI-related putative proteinase inhibitor [Chloroflexota bacterium]